MASLDLSQLPLNWELAVLRFERDVRDDFFPDPLQNRDLFTSAKVNVANVLNLADYKPEPAESWDVPKPNLTLRHCINVTAVDRLVFQALVDYLCHICDPMFSPRSFAHRLRGPNEAEMYKKAIEQSAAFDAAVRERLLANPNAVLVTVDIAQYFENISFELLKTKLVALTGARLGHPTHAIIDVLMECLKRWSPYKHCGMPQNMFPSAFLGNALLHSLDVEMQERGFDYFRYMDDLRIVAPDEGTGRQALNVAITHLRQLELSVNAKKTGIIRPGTPEMARYTDAPKTDFAEIEAIIDGANLAELPNVVERLNAMLAEDVAAATPNERRLKFVVARLTSLRRLRKLPVPEPPGVGVALLRLLRFVPEPTPLVCRYFLNGDCSPEMLSALVDMLTADPLCVYGWQNYHLWLLAAQKGHIHPALIERARRIVQQGGNNAELGGAALYLGSVDEIAELRPIVDLLREPQQSATILRALVTAIQRLNDEDVLAIVGRLAARSATLAVLERYLRRLRAPTYVARQRRVSLRSLADEMPDKFS